MKLTKQQLIDKLGMLPLSGSDIRSNYNTTDVFQQVKEIILKTEIIPDPELEPKPEPVDTELEEAKKLIGSYVNYKRGDPTLFLVQEVFRNCSGNLIVLFKSSASGVAYEDCTPATLPTRKINWRCMKTDAPDTERDVWIKVEPYVGYYQAWCRDPKNWIVYGCCLDISKYNTALWCELDEIEGE